MGRIRNPLYLHRYLGFESLSLRHYIEKAPQLNKLRGFFISSLYQRLLQDIFQSCLTLIKALRRFAISLITLTFINGDHEHRNFLIDHLIHQPVPATTQFDLVAVRQAM